MKGDLQISSFFLLFAYSRFPAIWVHCQLALPLLPLQLALLFCTAASFTVQGSAVVESDRCV